MDWRNPYTLSYTSGCFFFTMALILMIKLISSKGIMLKSDYYRVIIGIFAMVGAGSNTFYEPWAVTNGYCNVYLATFIIFGSFFIAYSFYFMYLIDRLIIVYPTQEKFRPYIMIISITSQIPVLVLILLYSRNLPGYCSLLVHSNELHLEIIGTLIYVVLDMISFWLFIRPLIYHYKNLSPDMIGLLERLAIQQLLLWILDIVAAICYSIVKDYPYLQGFLGGVLTTNLLALSLWIPDFIYYIQLKRGKSTLFFSTLKTTKTSVNKLAKSVISKTWNEPQNVLATPAYLFTDAKFQIDHEIGKGGTAKVLLIHTEDSYLIERAKGKQIVMKILSSGSYDSFNLEISIMAMFSDHPNFAQMIGYNDTNRSIFLIYYPLGTLEYYIMETNQTIRLKTYFYILQGIVTGINELHQSGIVHNDIKPQNILLEQNGGVLVPKIIDFGIANLVTTKTLKVQQFHVAPRLGVSFRYSAPEKLNPRQFIVNHEDAFKADMYSLSIVIWEMVSKTFAWSTTDSYQIQKDPEIVIHPVHVLSETTDYNDTETTIESIEPF